MQLVAQTAGRRPRSQDATGIQDYNTAYAITGGEAMEKAAAISPQVPRERTASLFVCQGHA